MREVPRRVIVLGAGAIGASVGALLAEQGVDCVFVARGEHGRALAERGLDLRLPEGSRRVWVPTVGDVAELGADPEDLVLLATTGHHTDAAMAEVDPAVPVASFQNGLAPLDRLVARGHPTSAAMVFVPAERRGPGIVALPAVPVPGSVILGGWPRGLGAWTPWLVGRLRAAGFRAEAEEDIAPWIRAKLLMNLGGIVVALCDDPPVDVVAAAQNEARAVWHATGDVFEDVLALLARVGPLEMVPVDGVPRRGGSTRSAIARGDAPETAFLHDGVRAAGRAHGVPTPVNDALVRLAEEAVAARRMPGSYDADTLRRACGLPVGG